VPAGVTSITLAECWGAGGGSAHGFGGCGTRCGGGEYAAESSVAVTPDK